MVVAQSLSLASQKTIYMKNLKTTFALTLLFITSVLSAQQTTTPTPTATPALKVKEFGIGIVNLNSFSLQYRWGNEKVLCRVTGNIGATGLTNNNNTSNTNYQNNGSSSSTSDGTQTKTPLTLNTGVGFSILSLKQINPKFGLMVGGTAGLTYSYNTGQNTITNSSQNNTNGNTWQSSTTKSTSQTLQPYMGCVLGAYFKINPSFIIYAEIAPNLFYATTQTTSNTTYQYYPAGLNSKSGDTRVNNNNFGISGLSNSGAMLTFVYRITK